MLPPRNTLGLLGGDGYRAFAPDWPGHGDSDKPAAGAFAYSEEAYVSALRAFVDSVGINKPFALVVQVRACSLWDWGGRNTWGRAGHRGRAGVSVASGPALRKPACPPCAPLRACDVCSVSVLCPSTLHHLPAFTQTPQPGPPAQLTVLVHAAYCTCTQGFVLGQYGLLYALEHPDQVARLCILNTPLALNAKLRPELAAYKAPLPFMRPGNVRCALAYVAGCVFVRCWSHRCRSAFVRIGRMVRPGAYAAGEDVVEVRVMPWGKTARRGAGCTCTLLRQSVQLLRIRICVVMVVEQPGWQLVVRDALEAASCCGVCGQPCGARPCTPHGERAPPCSAVHPCRLQLSRRPPHFGPCRSRSTS